MPQDTPSKSSFPSRPRLTRQQTLGGARPYLTASKVCQLISFLAITLCHRSDPRLMLGRKVLKKADLRNMCQALAGAGMATVMPMTRHTVIANFVTDTEIIDRLLDLLRAVTPDTRDLRDRYNSHHHSRYDSASSWCHDGRGQYRREPLEDYYPGDYYDSPRPPYRDYYDRGHERDPYEPRYESTRSRTVANDYRPVSPRQPSLVRCPRSPSSCLTRTPPQPRSPPPPTPPRSELQTRHPTISIPLPKKPSAHMVSHSPPSVSHPPSRSSSGEGSRRDVADVSLPEKVIPKTSEKSNELQPPHQPPRPVRPPLRRTREEEYKAYGRTFEGSGQQDDYDAMTKLGEGTFGHVLFSSTNA